MHSPSLALHALGDSAAGQLQQLHIEAYQTERNFIVCADTLSAVCSAELQHQYLRAC
jgi:hypothetical protein